MKKEKERKKKRADSVDAAKHETRGFESVSLMLIPPLLAA
jgi:hypothetical protein